MVKSLGLSAFWSHQTGELQVRLDTWTATVHDKQGKPLTFTCMYTPVIPHPNMNVKTHT